MPEKEVNLWYLLTRLICLKPLLETRMFSSFRNLNFFQKKKKITKLIRGQENTESKNGWDWKEALKVTWSNLLVQAQPPQTGYPGPCLDSCWILQKEDSTDFLGNLCQCSVKSFFLMFRRSLLCFIFFPLPLVLSLGTITKLH